MSEQDWIRYANQGATRRQPLSPELAQALRFLPELGLTAEVFSGGQSPLGVGGPRVGSTRHDHGNAADVFFYKDGRRIDWSNPADTPVFQDIVRRGKAAGLTGFGAGPGYMRPGSMHIGFGSPGVWGAGGKGANAPDWLRQAYGAAVASAATKGGPRQAPQAAAPALGPPRTIRDAPVAALNAAPAAPQPAAPAGLGGLFAQNAPGIGMALNSFVDQRRQREEEEKLAQQRRMLLLADLYA